MDALVEIVSVLEQLGLHGLLVKLALAPDGRPDALKVTACAVPESNVLVIVFDPDPPWLTVMFPELLSE